MKKKSLQNSIPSGKAKKFIVEKKSFDSKENDVKKKNNIFISRKDPKSNTTKNKKSNKTINKKRRSLTSYVVANSTNHIH